MNEKKRESKVLNQHYLFNVYKHYVLTIEYSLLFVRGINYFALLSSNNNKASQVFRFSDNIDSVDNSSNREGTLD